MSDIEEKHRLLSEKLAEMKAKSTTPLQSCGAAIFWIVTLPGWMMLSGLLVKTLWGWFIAPLGMPALSIWHAVGISLLTHVLTRDVDRKSKPFFERLVYMAFYYISYFGMGWAAHYAMGRWS